MPKSALPERQGTAKERLQNQAKLAQQRREEQERQREEERRRQEQQRQQAMASQQRYRELARDPMENFRTIAWNNLPTATQAKVVERDAQEAERVADLMEQIESVGSSYQKYIPKDNLPYESAAQARQEATRLRNQYEQLRTKSYLEEEQDRIQTAQNNALGAGNLDYMTAIGVSQRKEIPTNPKYNDLRNAVEYIWLRDDPEAQSRYGADFAARFGDGLSDRVKVTSMTPEEQQTMLYYVGIGDYDKAADYLEDLERTLNARANGQVQENLTKWAQEHPIQGALTNIFSWPLAIPSTVDAFGQAVAQQITGQWEPADPNRDIYVGARLGSATSEGVSEAARKAATAAFGSETAGDVAAFLTGTGLSIGQNATQVLALGGWALPFMSASAAGMSTVDTLDRGGSYGQAATMGTISGLVEAVTEKIPLDNLLRIANRSGKTTARQAVADVLRQMGTEATEESISEIAGNIADIAIMADKSEYKQYVQQLVDAGMNRGQAEKEAFAQFFLINTLLAGAGGAISGGVMGGGADILNAIGNRAQNRLDAQSGQTGADLRQRAMEQAKEQVERQMGQTQEQQPATARERLMQQARQAQAQRDQAGQEPDGLTLPAPDGVSQGQSGQADSLEDSGRRAGVEEGTIQTARRVSDALGREVRFYDGAAEAGPAGAANGYYAGGTIYVNSRSANPVAQIISHELTHSVETAEAYQQLRGLVLDRIQQTGGNLEQLRQAKQELYQRHGVELQDQSAIDAEIVAEYVERNLLTDEGAILELARTDRTLAQRIREWIDALLARLGNTDAQERAFLERARNAYARALEQTAPAGQSMDTRTEQTGAAQTQQNREGAAQAQQDQAAAAQEQQNQAGEEQEGETSQRRQEIRQTLEQLRQAYNAGQITEEQFDTSMDIILEAEGLAGVDMLDERFSFGGERAQRADMDALARAREMENQDVSEDTILRETGWFRGADGKWRFEIDNSNLEYSRWGDMRRTDREQHRRFRELEGRFAENTITQEEQAELRRLVDEGHGQSRGQETEIQRVGDFIQDAELFANYPWLERVPMRFEDLPGETLGQYDAGEIIIDSSLRDAPEETILHEIQHAIQREEGFAKGSSPAYWQWRIDQGTAPRSRGQIARQQEFIEALRDMRAENPQMVDDVMALMEMVPDVPRGKTDWDTLEQVTEDPVEWQQFDARRDELEERYGFEGVHDAMHVIEMIRRLEERPDNRGAYDLYYNTAGEIEARGAGSRRNMTAQERRENMPFRRDDQTVFREQYSISEDGQGRELSPEQQEFFRDSQIRDEQGRLRAVYHGTSDGDFNAFDWSETGRRDVGWFGRGFYFTFYEGEARMYGRRVIPAYLNITNPYVFDEQLYTLDGVKPEGAQASDLAFMINFAQQFPELAGDRTLTVVTQWGEDGTGQTKEIPWSELRGELDRVLENPSFRIEALTSPYGETYYEWSVKTGPGRYDYATTRSQYETREQAQAGRLDAAAELLFNRIYRSADLHMGHTHIQDMATQFTQALQERGYDGVLQTREGDEVVAFRPEQIKRVDNRNPTDSADIRYSISEDYVEELDQWDRDGRPDGEVFILGATGDVLQGLGAMEQDIYLRSEKVNTILRDHQEMTLEEIKRIPEILDDPVLVIKSNGSSRGGQNTRLVITGTLRAQNGRPVMAALDLRPVENGLVIDDMQKVNSAYGRSNAANYVQDSEVLYADKKRTIPLLQTMGLQSRPIELQRYGSMGSISYNRQNVNIQGVPFDQVVRTTGQAQYSISEEQDERRRIAGDLRSILDRGGDARALREYVDGLELGAAFDTDTEQDTDTAAREIIREAHDQGIGVEEYLRRNWEQYDYDGALNQDARRALELERQRSWAARRYSIDPERVEITPEGTEVVRDATQEEERRMRQDVWQDYPWLRETGETVLRSYTDEAGNTYTWRADQDTPAQYSLEGQEEQRPIDAAQLPTLEEYEQSVVDRLPTKARLYLNRAESKLANSIASALSVPRGVERTDLRDAVRQLSTEFLNTGTISQDTIDGLFQQAWDRGLVVDREFYDEYKDLRDYLREKKIVIDRGDANDIPDFNEFRKSLFGRVNLSTTGRVNIEEVYRDMAEKWPELFNADTVIHPSDQLLSIVDAINSIRVAEYNLDAFYGAQAEEFRRYARNDFNTAIRDAMSDLRAVRNYQQDRERQERERRQAPANLEQVQELWGQVKAARKQYEKAMARNLLSERDQQQVGLLLRGEIEAKDLKPETDNVQGILQVYAAKREYNQITTALRLWNQNRRSQLRQQADNLLATANDWKDKRAGILYSRETMERNIRDIVPDEATAQRVIDTYFTPVHQAAAAANRMKNQYRDRVRQLKLSRKVAKGNVVSEAHAVQLLGEAEDNIRVLQQSQGRLRDRDGKSLADWRGVVEDLWAQNPNLDQAKIRGAVQEFRNIYDGLFRQMNEVRVRNGYEPVNYRQGYFPHFQPGEGDGILQLMGKALGIGTEVTALPTSINGLTHTFRPGIRWFGNAQKRLGFNTAYDAVEGFDRYIEGVADVIHQTDNIQRLRALATQIRYRTGDDGIRAQIDDIRANPNLAEEDKENRIQNVLENGRYTLSNFVVELDEYTNLLANKKSRADRNMEQALGRKMFNVVKGLEGRVAANMVAVNPASWLTNFIPLTQAWAGVDSRNMMKGMWQTLQAYKQDDGMVARSAFLTNRRGSDPLVRTWAQGASAAASRPMEWIDTFVADSIVRARYNQNLSKGMSEQSAIDEADSFAANVMADRSKGSMPTLFNRSNPITKVFTQFQLEVNNQLSYLFKDLPKEAKKKGIAALAAALLKFALGAFIFDEIYEYLIGRRPALDPIGILNDTVGDLTGYELPNLVELGVGAASGNVPSFQVEQAGLQQAGSNLAGNLLESMPFIGGLLGGGRLPISSAVPDINALWNAATAPDWDMKKRLQEVRDELLEKPATYLVLPFGGGQLKKIYEAVEGVIQGGSYTVNTEGEEQLQFPIYTDDPLEALASGIAAGVFGRTSLPTGRDWIEGGFGSLSARQTATYQGLVDAGVEQRAAYALIQELRDAEKTEDKSQADVQREILENAEISADGKAVAYYGLLAADSEREIMDDLAGQGADSGEVARVLMAIKDAGALGGTQGSVAKREAILDASLSQDEKLYLYRNMISDSQDEQIQQVRGSGLNVDDYILAQNKLDELKEQGLTGDKRNDEFYYWVDRQSWSQSQADAVKEAFTAYNPETGEGGGYYNEFTVAGLPDETAKSLSEQLDLLQPEAGADKVTEWQEAQAVVDSGIQEDLQMQALGVVMDESSYTKLTAGYGYGLQPSSYIRYKQIIKDFDTDGSGRYSQAETRAAIDSMIGLTNTEKAILWQLQQKNWTAYNNPYSSQVGWQVYDALHASGTTQTSSTAEQGTGGGTTQIKIGDTVIDLTGLSLPTP